MIIKDLGSTNGTYINRASVKEAELADGSTVNLGGVVLMYYADGLSKEPTASPPLPLAPASAPAAIPVPPPVRVHVRPVAPPQTATEAPPPPAPALHAVPLVTDQPQNCKSHPRTSARFFCPGCCHYFCELCVNSRAVQATQHKFCRHCGAECVPIQVQAQALLATKQRGFFARLPQAFLYPCRGSGILVLIVGTILLGALKFVAGSGGLSLGTMVGVRNGLPWSWWALLMQVFVLGYLFAYMQNVIHSTAAEESELPPLPSMTNFWEDILLPCLQFLGLMIFCFGPTVGIALLAGSSEDGTAGLAALATLCLGAFYFPMAFLAAALLDSFLAANPLTVVPAILKAPLEYIVTIILLATVFALRLLGDSVLPALFPRGLTTHSMPKLAVFLAAEAVWSVVCLYLLTVGVHILGLLYVSKKQRFGWLNR